MHGEAPAGAAGGYRTLAAYLRGGGAEAAIALAQAADASREHGRRNADGTRAKELELLLGPLRACVKEGLSWPPPVRGRRPTPPGGWGPPPPPKAPPPRRKDLCKLLGLIECDVTTDATSPEDIKVAQLRKELGNSGLKPKTHFKVKNVGFKPYLYAKTDFKNLASKIK